MLLSELVIQNIGPFAEPTRILFESDVTVLTGANDTGKTSVLTAIELVCGMLGGGRVLEETDVNMDRIGSAATEWRKDTEITCEAVFDTTEHSAPHIKRGIASGGEVSVHCRIAPDVRQVSATKFRQVKGAGGWSTGGNVAVAKFPTVIRLPLPDPVRTVVSLTQPNPTELEFLRASFGPQFTHGKYSALSDSYFYNALSKAKGDANAKLRRFLPPSVKLEFDFQPISTKREQISVQLRDGHEGHTPLGVRGAGIGRIIALMAALLSVELDDRHYIILIDEPENSLHADAQHTLRAILEELASKPNIQVVYATHSPSMINPIRTSAIRLLTRANNGRVAHSIIEHRPIDENFLSIRSSLGITPSDSLLYAPVTIVVEGPSEVIGLPIILGRLWRDSVDGFEDVGHLLPQVHFLDGCGDSFDQLCKVSMSQGAKPVVFLDGDKAGSRLNKIKKRFSDVPIVLLDGKTEFEEIVPREHYFSSLGTVMEEFSIGASDKLTMHSFEKWEAANKPHQQMAFSKRIERWVQDTVGLSIEKPLVMKHVLSTVPTEDVMKDKLAELIGHIRQQLS